MLLARFLMFEKRLTYAAMAELSGMGEARLRDLCTAVSEPTQEELEAVASALGYELDLGLLFEPCRPMA